MILVTRFGWHPTKIGTFHAINKFELKGVIWQLVKYEESSLLTAADTPFGWCPRKHLSFGLNAFRSIFQKSLQYQKAAECNSVLLTMFWYLEQMKKSRKSILSISIEQCNSKDITFPQNKINLIYNSVSPRGHFLAQDGPKVDFEKIKAIKHWHKRSYAFISMNSYLSPFLPNWADIILAPPPHPNNLTKKTMWHRSGINIT